MNGFDPLPRSVDEIIADMQRLGLDAGREEIDRLVAVEARRRELEGDAGEGEFYNDKVRRWGVEGCQVPVPRRACRLVSLAARRFPASSIPVKAEASQRPMIFAPTADPRPGSWVSVVRSHP